MVLPPSLKKLAPLFLLTGFVVIHSIVRLVILTVSVSYPHLFMSSSLLTKTLRNLCRLLQIIIQLFSGLTSKFLNPEISCSSPLRLQRLLFPRYRQFGFKGQSRTKQVVGSNDMVGTPTYPTRLKLLITLVNNNYFTNCYQFHGIVNTCQKTKLKRISQKTISPEETHLLSLLKLTESLFTFSFKTIMLCSL